MKISQVLDAAKVCLESKAATLTLVGQSGVAKTTIFTENYKQLGYDRVEVIRPALFADAADLIGLPEFHTLPSGEVVTRFARPSWLPEEGEKVLIVVDEINRASKDVSNALFGLIESAKPHVGEYFLPETCGVVATCNPPTDNYGGVLDLRDNAWSSRLCFVKVTPTLEDFNKYGRKTGNVSDVMLSFLAKNEKYAGSIADFEVDMFFNKSEGGGQEMNLRSLEKASRLLEAGKDANVAREITFELIRGTKGLEFATAFMQFSDEYKSHVSLDDILADAKNIEKFDVTAMSNINKILEDFKHRVEKGTIKTKKANKNFVKFLEIIPIDTFQGFVAYVSANTTIDNSTVFDTLAEEIVKSKVLFDPERAVNLEKVDMTETTETTEASE